MSLQNFDFPGVTLTQSFAETGAGNISEQSVACIGQQYKLVEATDADYKAANKVEYTGEATTKNITPSGSTGVIDYVTEYQSLAMPNAAVQVCSITAVDNATTDLEARVIGFTIYIKDGNGNTANEAFKGRGVAVGDPVVLSGTGSADPVYTKVLAVGLAGADAAAGYKTITVGDVGTLTAVTTVKFCVERDVVYAGGTGAFTLASTGTLTIASNLEATTGIPVETSEPDKGLVLYATAYPQFREKRFDYKGVIESISSTADVDEVLGKPCAANPLALACYCALAAGNNTTVYFTGISAEDPDEYAEAIDLMGRMTNIYSIVPCTEDANIIRACLQMCQTQSEDPESIVRRSLWYGITQDDVPTIWEGTASFGMDSSTFTGLVTTSTDAYTNTAVREGDKLVLTVAPYTEWDVEGVAGEGIIEVDTTPGAPATATNQPVKIVRTRPLNRDLVADIIGKRVTQSIHAQGVWADGFRYNGETIANYAAAAAAAGMRAYEPCQRPLANLGYGFFTLAESHGFTRSQLKDIGKEGIWIIANNDEGTPINMRAITTAVANNLLKDEESIISNVDNMAVNLRQIGTDLVGCSNISPELLDLLEDQVIAKLDYFSVNRTGSVAIGPQILEYNFNKIYQDPVNLDEVWAEFDVTPPRPFNKFHMVMRVL